MPIVAGFASAAYDSAVTNQVGNTARDIFVPPAWVKEEQARTGLGIHIFFPSTRLARWVELLRARVQEEQEEEMEQLQGGATPNSGERKALPTHCVLCDL